MNRILGYRRSAAPALVVLAVLLLAACGRILPRPGGVEGLPTPDQATPLPGGLYAPAAANMQNLLAQQLGLPPASVRIVKVEPTQWPDGCLGAATPGETCPQSAVPGYSLTYEADGLTYVLHTDSQGYQWRVAEASVPVIGAPVMQWTGKAENGACREATLARDGIAFGLCGGRHLGAKYASPKRALAVADFAARYAPFEANTPIGAVRFTGTGTQVATPAEQRMLASWAWLAQTEAQTGQSGVSWGMALNWRREGGIAGFCDDLSVDVAGEVFAAGCKGSQVQPVGSMGMNDAQLTQFYRWIDALEPFEHETKDPATADAMTVRLLFSGQGSGKASDADRQAISLFAQELYSQLAGRGPSGTEPEAFCPQAGAGLQALANPLHGYCLAYPEAYKVEKPNPTETILLIGGLQNASDARVHIAVEDAAGRTAADAAATIEADFKDMGVERSTATVAGADAVVLDKVPGQEINRLVLFVNAGTLYRLMFMPADPAVDAYQAMEALYKQILQSFTFLPKTTEATHERLAAGPDTQLLTSDQAGFCLLYPHGFQVDLTVAGQVEVCPGRIWPG